MKIKQSDFEQLINEEAVRLFKIQKLEEAKSKIQKNLKLIAEGKDSLKEEELNELLSGLKNLFNVGAKKTGQAIAKGAEISGQALAKGAEAIGTAGNNIKTHYQQGEWDAEKAKKERQRDSIVAQIKHLGAQYEALTGKKYSQMGQAIANVKSEKSRPEFKTKQNPNLGIA